MSELEWTPVQITLSCLEFWQDNPKLLTRAEAAKLEKSSRKLGRAGVLLVGPESNGRRPLYDGHQRANIWRTLYGIDAPINALQSSRPLTDSERRAVSVMTVTAAGSFDWQKLAGWDFAELSDFGMDGDLLKGWNNDANNLKELIRAEQAEPVDAEPQIDRAAELNEKWQVKAGDLWQIGEHRLLCGDSTSENDLRRLMEGDKARLLETDPPYGIDYNSAELHQNKTSYDEIEKDELKYDEFQRWLEIVFKTLRPHLSDNCAWYLWHPMLTQGYFAAAAAAAAAGVIISRQIIWVKPQLIFGRGEYHWKHELCFYGWIKGNRPPFYGDRNQVTVWEIGYDGKRNDRIHPTEKPPELWFAPIKNHTLEGEVCLEPFAGSGSQLVACQNLSRKCRAIEISPNYCAVILERMSTAFPELEITRIS